MTFHAQLTFEATKKWDGRRINKQYEHIWTNWADRFLAAQSDLVVVDPSPQNQYNLGLAFYASDRFVEAIATLRIAEDGYDDEISIKSTKLIDKISSKLPIEIEKSADEIDTELVEGEESPSFDDETVPYHVWLDSQREMDDLIVPEERTRKLRMVERRCTRCGESLGLTACLRGQTEHKEPCDNRPLD